MSSLTQKASALDFIARSTVNVEDASCYPVAPDAIFEMDVREQEDGSKQFILFIKDDLGRMQHRIRFNGGSVRSLIGILSEHIK